MRQQDGGADDILENFTLLPAELSFLGDNAPHNQRGKALLLKTIISRVRFTRPVPITGSKRTLSRTQGLVIVNPRAAFTLFLYHSTYPKVKSNTATMSTLRITRSHKGCRSDGSSSTNACDNGWLHRLQRAALS
jgi:hypothetical protein